MIDVAQKVKQSVSLKCNYSLLISVLSIKDNTLDFFLSNFYCVLNASFCLFPIL